jgi:hypothetical protein
MNPLPVLVMKPWFLWFLYCLLSLVGSVRFRASSNKSQIDICLYVDRVRGMTALSLMLVVQYRAAFSCEVDALDAAVSTCLAERTGVCTNYSLAFHRVFLSLPPTFSPSLNTPTSDPSWLEGNLVQFLTPCFISYCYISNGLRRHF